MTIVATEFFRKDLPLPAGNLFLRLLAAKVIAAVERTTPAIVAAQRWPSDRLIERATSAPAMTSVAGWAAELAHQGVADTIEAFGPSSVGIEVLRRGLVVNLEGYGAISVPGLVANAARAFWVAEGAPIPVVSMPTDTDLLKPYKLGTIAVLTREMVESSNAERLIGDVLVRSAGLALDTALFDANPATAARPAGLRNGIAATTASNNADMREAVVQDLVTLINAVAAIGGPYIAVTSPGRAAGLYLRAARETPYVTVLAAPTMGNDIMVIAAPTLAAAFSPEPEIETSKAATLVMDDATPTAAGLSGPERSMFQIDSLAVKVRWPLSWAVRNPAGIAWMTPAWK